MMARRALWTACLLGALTLYLFENSTVTRMVLGILVLLPVLSAGITVWASRRVTLRLEVPDTASKETAIAGMLTVTSTAPWMPVRLSYCLRCRNRFTGAAQDITLEAIEQSSSFAFSSSHCGLVEITLDAVRLHDPLGLLAFPVEAALSAQVLVQPNLFITRIDLLQILHHAIAHSACQPIRVRQTLCLF